MNIPHQRNFGTHESIVFNFITDVANGDDLSGIRWVELRRTAATEWYLYQEGTFAPEDGLHRFMGSIAIDEAGNIGMAYNVANEDTYVGLRYTGRFAGDQLGMMTIPEVSVVDGTNSINSGARFGDYAQMSVTPNGDNTFWYTGEYAGGGNSGSRTRIFSFKLNRDSFDLATTNIMTPAKDNLSFSTDETVTVNYSNLGVNSIIDFELGYMMNGVVMETILIEDELISGGTILHEFNNKVDMSNIGDYTIKAFVSHTLDELAINDTLEVNYTNYPILEVALESSLEGLNCSDEFPNYFTVFV